MNTFHIITYSIILICSIIQIILIGLRIKQINKEIKKNKETAKKLEEIGKELNFFSNSEN